MRSLWFSQEHPGFYTDVCSALNILRLRASQCEENRTTKSNSNADRVCDVCMWSVDSEWKEWWRISFCNLLHGLLPKKGSQARRRGPLLDLNLVLRFRVSMTWELAGMKQSVCRPPLTFTARLTSSGWNGQKVKCPLKRLGRLYLRH